MLMPTSYGIAAMSARETLADNLRRLMESHHTLKSTLAIEKATDAIGQKVGKSTIDRALKCQTTLNLDYIDAIAKVYGLDAWQLLTPNIVPRNPPVLRTVGDVEDKLYQKLGELAKEIVTLQEDQK